VKAEFGRLVIVAAIVLAVAVPRPAAAQADAVPPVATDSNDPGAIAAGS